MKIELLNKQLVQDLTNLAEANYLTPELFIKQILETYVSENSKQDYSKIDFTVSGMKRKADNLSNTINIMLDKFKQSCDFSEVRLVEDINKKIKLEVKL